MTVTVTVTVTVTEMDDVRRISDSAVLATMANAGLAAEVPELARDRRERWWQRTASSLSWSPEDFAGDPAGQTIAQAAESINVAYLTRAMRGWAEAGRWAH